MMALSRPAALALVVLTGLCVTSCGAADKKAMGDQVLVRSSKSEREAIWKRSIGKHPHPRQNARAPPLTPLPPFPARSPSQVTCGSAIKLAHAPSGRLLHSHDVKYGSGSGQHSVTSVAARADPGSLWLVRGLAPAPGSPAPCPPGTPVKAGASIRLQHAASGRWLHSHAFPSPLTRNQEVSAFGGPGHSDEGDVWAVEAEKGAASWARGAPVRLRHGASGAFLASPDRAYGHPIAGQHEVCGRRGSDPWTAEEGVYLRQEAARAGGAAAAAAAAKK